MGNEDDVRFMREALDLAKTAEGRTTPDPMVGAVLVKGGRIISVGYHGEVATPHAESWAIQKAGEDARGSTLYVNLEPCNHYGNNPPCTETIIRSGVKRVVASMKDPNPLVKGKGFARLRRHGVKVEIGLLDEEARRMNEVFIKYMSTGLPFVVMKSAMTLDGKIATYTGASRWVASTASLRFAHHLRNLYDAILVGIGTVLVDNPRLDVRRVQKIKDPIRVVLDTHARTPLKAEVLNVPGARTIVVVGPDAPRKKTEALTKKGAQIIVAKVKKGEIDVRDLLVKLAEIKITSVLVEGGGEVNASFVEAKLVDKAHFSITPKIFGGREAKTPVEGQGVRLPSQAHWLKSMHVERLENDILISGYFNH